MAIQAEKLPVASVGWIVVVVVVPVMHRKLLQVLARELARAAAADPRIDLEGLLAVALVALRSAALRLGDQPVQPVLIWLAHLALKFAASVPTLRGGLKNPTTLKWPPTPE